MFDGSPWNDFPWMLNKRSAEIALRRIAHGLGLMPERIPMDGYEVFVPPDDQFGKIKTKFRFKDAAQVVAPSDRPKTAAATSAPAAAGGYAFPALAWLEDFASQRWRRIVFVIPPPHISDIAPPGTAGGR